MARQTIAKIDVVRRQLDAAIDLTFQGSDPIAIHTIAFAAKEVAGDLCGPRRSSFDQACATLTRPGKETAFHQALRKHALFFKHAKQDAEATIEMFDDEANDFLIFWGISRFVMLSPGTTRMTWFDMWIRLQYPEAIDWTPATSRIQLALSDLFATVGAGDRTARLRLGEALVAVALKDQARIDRAFDALAGSPFHAAVDSVLRKGAALGIGPPVGPAGGGRRGL